MAIHWLPREPPLIPQAVAAWGQPALELAARLLSRHPETLARLSGIASTGCLVLVGEAEDLPWVDGVIYLGRSVEAPRLLLPTTLRPAVPEDLFERAVVARESALRPPIVVLPGLGALFSLVAARPVDAGVLRAWLSRNGGPKLPDEERPADATKAAGAPP